MSKLLRHLNPFPILRREIKRLSWAILAVAVTLVGLDLLEIRFELASRWALIVGKLSIVSTALILAHLSWKAMFPYIDTEAILHRDDRGNLDASLLFLGVILGRMIFYGAIILAFALGL